MNVDKRAFDVKPLLDALCESCGYSEFGYRIQALFAHVLLRLGARITEVNAQGHPDVKAELCNRQLRFQVKAVVHAQLRSQLILTPEDLAGIGSRFGSDGYLAILDCAMPVNWIVIPESRARLFVERPMLIATLQAERIEPLSSECTDVFLDLILEEKGRLEHLPFGIVARRALRAEPL